VAEGVEGADVLQRLRSLHCDEAQGFHLSRPLPAEALVEWLRGRRPATAQPV
jgi:EAL domain-containing protein (putative c-di-GMP-specific phosphodiesterase class I)